MRSKLAQGLQQGAQRLLFILNKWEETPICSGGFSYSGDSHSGDLLLGYEHAFFQ